jgi:hypothetical protein
MPLRDHFRPPPDDLTAREGFHGGWPMMIVQALARSLPRRSLRPAPAGMTPARAGWPAPGPPR